MHLNPDQVLYVQGGLGRLHRVIAAFSDADAANTYMASAPGEAVIAIFGPVIFLARMDDRGFSQPRLP